MNKRGVEGWVPGVKMFQTEKCFGCLTVCFFQMAEEGGGFTDCLLQCGTKPRVKFCSLYQSRPM